MTTAADIAKDINAELGEGSLKLGSDPSLQVGYLPTGVLPIDVLLKGGIPTGRFTEIYGDYSTLKSYVALRAIATTQAAGGKCGLVDTEHAYDPEWLEQQGGDPGNLLVCRSNYGERAVGVVQSMVTQGYDLVVWDSIAATQPKSVHERNPEDTVQPGRLAAMMSESLRRLNAVNRHTSILCLNQTRINVGITFGSNESVPGGRAMPFYASYRIKFAKAGRVFDDVKTWDGDKYVSTKRQIGLKIKASLEKSKLNKPHREAWFTYDMHNGTVDDTGFLVSQGLEHGLIQHNGKSWTMAHRPKSVVGKDKFKQSLTNTEQQWLTNCLMADDDLAFPGEPAPGRSRARKPKRP